FKKLLPNISQMNAQIMETEEAVADTMPEPVVEAPVVVASAPEPVQASAARAEGALGASSTVTALRLGEHPGKTRIVLDMAGAGPYTFEVDNGEKILLVTLPQSAWSAAMQEAAADYSMISGYTATPMT